MGRFRRMFGIFKHNITVLNNHFFFIYLEIKFNQYEQKKSDCNLQTSKIIGDYYKEVSN